MEPQFINGDDAVKIEGGRTSKGNCYVDFRHFYKDSNTGAWMPTKKGCRVYINTEGEAIKLLNTVQEQVLEAR
jgi:hypothetical protein